MKVRKRCVVVGYFMGCDIRKAWRTEGSQREEEDSASFHLSLFHSFFFSFKIEEKRVALFFSPEPFPDSARWEWYNQHIIIYPLLLFQPASPPSFFLSLLSVHSSFSLCLFHLFLAPQPPPSTFVSATRTFLSFPSFLFFHFLLQNSFILEQRLRTQSTVIVPDHGECNNNNIVHMFSERDSIFPPFFLSDHPFHILSSFSLFAQVLSINPPSSLPLPLILITKMRKSLVISKIRSIFGIIPPSIPSFFVCSLLSLSFVSSFNILLLHLSPLFLFNCIISLSLTPPLFLLLLWSFWYTRVNLTTWREGRGKKDFSPLSPFLSSFSGWKDVKRVNKRDRGREGERGRWRDEKEIDKREKLY